MRISLTSDHKYRQRALAVPGGFWDKPEGEYALIDPTPRAARAAIALFPDVLNRHPELDEVSNRGLENARPTDNATRLGVRLDCGTLGDKVALYDWQDVDAGYLYQIMQRDGGANVLWDRGLGKTTVAAAFIKKLEAQRTLVVCRNDAKEPVWRAQLEELLPDHRLYVLPNPKHKRENMLAMFTGRTQYEGKEWDPEIFIVHYESLALIAGDRGKGKGWDKLGDWDLMVFDEGHRLASMNPNGNNNTQMGKGTMKARKRSSMAINLTGSSIMNHAQDLFGQLHYLFPNTYKAKWRDYNDRFLDYVEVNGQRVCIGFNEAALPELRDELGVFSVYRKKSEVLDLPPLIKQEILLELEPAQRKAYDEMRENFWAALPDDGGALMATNVLAQLNHLRQMATWVEGLPSAKLDFAYNEIMEDEDAQWVCFTWFKAPGRALAERLGDQAVVVDGDVAAADRALALECHRRGDARVLLGSISTLGESLNLQYCSRAIRLDRSWNPGVNDQTQDRLYRHGQKDSVLLLDLVAKNTIDELRVQPALTSKQSLRKAVFGS